MEGLAVGRIVHYVLENGFNAYRAAVITHIWNELGLVNLYIFPDGSFEISNLKPTSVEYNESGKTGTWHWPKKV